jgi:hypothetical protein
MYGVINKAIKDLLVQNFGEGTWEKVRTKSGVDIDSFLSNTQYSDELTFKLAIAASEVLNWSLRDVLLAFGKFWVLDTSSQHYGSLIQAGGSNYVDFMKNLPNFHNRVMLYFPNITPPEFRTSVLNEHEILVQYYSVRVGLTDFVEGLMLGIAELFKIEAKVELIDAKSQINDHDLFKITF